MVEKRIDTLTLATTLRGHHHGRIIMMDEWATTTSYSLGDCFSMKVIQHTLVLQRCLSSRLMAKNSNMGVLKM